MVTKIDGYDLLISRDLRRIAEIVSQELVKSTGRLDVGFCMVIFNKEAGSRANYVSNCKREDVKEALVELIEFWDAGGPDIPAHLIS